MVAGHGFGVQRLFGHEAPGAGGGLGESPPQGDPLLAGQPARPRAFAQQTACRSACWGASVERDTF